MKLRVSILIIIVFVQSCCDPCKEKNLGDISLNTDYLKYIEFNSIRNVELFNSNNYVTNFEYSVPKKQLEILETNCNGNMDCGFCCDYYNSDYYNFKLESFELPLRFDFKLGYMLLKKYSPQEYSQMYLKIKSKGIDAILYLPENNTGSANLVSGGRFVDTLSINNVIYINVYAFEDSLYVDTGSSFISSLYFNFEKGLIGFKLDNNETRSLLK